MILLLALGAIVSFPDYSKLANGQEQSVPVERVARGLQLSILTTKHRYKLNEQFKMLVMLANSGKEDVYVLGKLEWGWSASFLFHLRDASGKEIRPRAFPDDQTFVSPDDKGAFVKLPPSHFLGTDFFAPLELLNLNKPGKYSIFVEYHSPVSAADVEVRPFWGKENEPIKSNVVFIEVVR